MIISKQKLHFLDNDKIEDVFKKFYRKSFLKISFVGLGTVLNAGLGFFFLSAVAKHLAISEFGKYALLASLLVSLSKLMDFGTNSLFVSESISSENNNLVKVFLSNKILQFVVSIPISLLALYALHLWQGNLILIFILGLFFYGINYTLFGIFQKEENYLMLVLLYTVPALIKGLFAVLILTNLVSYGFNGYFAIFSLSIVPSILLITAVPKIYFKTTLDISNSWRTLKKAVSPGISQLIAEGFPAINNTIAKIYFGFTNVGIFSIADKISSAFVLVSFSVFTVLLPKNAARKRDNKGYDYTETGILSIGVLFLSVGAIIAARLFVPWFFEHKYDASLDLINLLVLSGALGSIHAFTENYFYVEGKTNYLALISGAKLAYLLIFSAFLIPHYALRGLAISHLAASTITVATIFYFMLRKKAELDRFKN